MVGELMFIGRKLMFKAVKHKFTDHKYKIQPQTERFPPCKVKFLSSK